ncbi:MAG: porin [Herminiimonas sp.]|nr:porin [Herminiimonas sp.]
MKKSLLALAVLGTLAGVASAQSNVTIYGIADVSVAQSRGGFGGNTTGLVSGVKNGSRLGFKGKEDLGGGLAANFVLENGFNIDDGSLGQGGLLFGRRATVGLSGGFGAIDFGRRNNPFFNALDAFEPMSTGYAGAANNLVNVYGIRQNNSVFYTTPDFAGLTGEVSYGFGEVAGNTSAGRQIGGSLTYANGPIGVALAHHNANDVGSNSRKSTILIGKYDFGVAAVHLGYVKETGNVASTTAVAGAAVDSNDALAGVSIPFGASTVLVSYIRKDDKTTANVDANQASIAYKYDLSKRTTLYTSYARINNKTALVYKTEAGVNEKEFNVGIQHRF